MKRSEMLEIMWEFISNVEHDYDIYMGERDTEELLRKMEDSGMLPPNTMRYIDQPSGNTLCSEVCEWDEE